MKCWIFALLFATGARAFAPHGPVTEASYHYWIGRAQTMFAPYIALSGHGLQIHKSWSSTATGCWTSLERPPVFQITLSGGAFKNAETTNDGLAYTICHEVAHIIGGLPRRVPESADYVHWGSAEGQADYMATNVCLKHLFATDDNVAVVRDLNVPAEVRGQCDSAYASNIDSALCQRSLMAGWSFAANNRRYKLSTFIGSRTGTAYRTLSAPLSFTKKDPTRVTEVNRSYSSPQCRLDTAVAGALCQRGLQFGLQSRNDPNQFNCAGADPQESHRPKCWFK